MRVKFTQDFDFYPPEHNGSVCVAYKAGTVRTDVRRIAAEQAAAEGKAEILDAGETEGDAPAGDAAAKPNKRSKSKGASDAGGETV